MKKAGKIAISPSLKDLEILVGSWAMELSNAPFLPDPTTVLRSSASFEWFEDGDFLILRQGSKNSKAPWATWFIGRDQDSPNYTVLYIDDRRFSRTYEMSFKKGVWKMWRNAPNFAQSFEAKLSEDKKTIKRTWKISTDGKTWEHDFDLTYKRIK